MNTYITIQTVTKIPTTCRAIWSTSPQRPPICRLCDPHTDVSVSHTRETQSLHTDTILPTSEPEENRGDVGHPSHRCSPTRRKPVCGVLSMSPGTVVGWKQPQRHEGSGRTVPPRWQGRASGCPLGRRTGGPWSLPVPPVLDTTAGRLWGEDTRL